MTMPLCTSVRIAISACVLLLFPAAATLHGQEPPTKYVDEKFSFSLTVSQPWQVAPLQNYAVPGVARTAYSGSDESSIVVFMQEPGQAIDPRFLVDESAKAIEKSLGATIRERDVRTIAGKKAMWLIVEGKGTGGAIDGKGAITTTQHWVAIPREKDIVVLLLTTPTEKLAAHRKSFEETLKTFVVGGKQSDVQIKSK